MSRAPLHTPQWFREEAERCFQFAEKIADQKGSDALMAYGRELLVRAERMEAVLSRAMAETHPEDSGGELGTPGADARGGVKTAEKQRNTMKK